MLRASHKKEIDPNSDQKLSFDKPIIQKVRVQTDRLVPNQPLKYDDFHTHIKPRYNLRKLNVLPYYLIKAKMIKGNLLIRMLKEVFLFLI